MYLDVALNVFLSERYALARNSSSRAGEALRSALAWLRPRVGRASPGSDYTPVADTPILAALRARLESIEREKDRVTHLALQEDDVTKQEAYLALARDLQREARAIREQIRLQES